jgi:hypothetical protein
MTTQSKLISWLRLLKSTIAEKDLSDNDLARHRAVVDRLVQSGTQLNFVISAAKSCPSCVDVRELQLACAKFAPQMIDDLLTLPGINRASVEADIIDLQHPVDVLSRLQKWYPYQDIPASHQQSWTLKLTAVCQSDMRNGTIYQRRLGVDSCEALTSALEMIGGTIRDPVAVTSIFRVAHTVLKGMARVSTPLLHTLSESFDELVISAVWSFAVARPDYERVEWRVKAQSFTLLNLSVLPNAQAWLKMHHPEEEAYLNAMWNEDTIAIANFISLQKIKYPVKNDIVNTDSSSSILTKPRQASATSADNLELDYTEFVPG